MTRQLVTPHANIRSTTLRSGLIASLLVVAAAVPLAGCGADQSSQNVSNTPLAGVNATTDDGILKLLNLTIPQPSAGAVPYPSGSTIPLNVRIFNDGARTARLTGVTVEGSTVGTASVVAFALPTPTSTAAPSGPTGEATGPENPAEPPPSAAPSTSRRTVSPSVRATATASRRGASASASVSSAPAPTPTPLPSLSPTETAAISIPLPAGQLVVLTQISGHYLAIKDLATDLRIGGSVRLTFVFAYEGAGQTSAQHVLVPIA